MTALEDAQHPAGQTTPMVDGRLGVLVLQRTLAGHAQARGTEVAALGLASTNAIAGLAQGVPASAGYLVGSVGPLVPAAIAAYGLNKSTSDRGTVMVLTGLAAATVLFGIARGVSR